MFYVDVLFVISPVFGFIPQIHKRHVVYKPLLSLLNIISAIIKIFDYKNNPYNDILLYQNCFIVILHFYLIATNMDKKYALDNKQISHLTTSVVTASAWLIMLYLFDYVKLGVLFGVTSMIVDLFTTYIQYQFYKYDPNRPRELFLFWMIGDLSKVYFNIFVYKSPFIYTCTILTQFIFNLLTVLTPSKPQLDLRYVNL